MFRVAQAEVSDYYQGTGYRMAYIKEPDRKKRRLFKFHTNSQEKNALLFYIGNEVNFTETLTKENQTMICLCTHLQKWCIPVIGVFLVCVCGARPPGASRTTRRTKAQSSEPRQCIFVCKTIKDLLLWMVDVKPFPLSEFMFVYFPSQDKHFAIVIAKMFTVHYGSKQISADHIQTNYTRYYIGGLPAQLKRR